MVAPSTSFVAFLIVSHMTVSSTMLVLNKAVLAALPFATSVLLAQVGSSAVILWVLGKTKVLDVDPLELNTMKAFFWNAFAFMALLYTNAKALESANVEAVVAFRTMSIFVTAYGDFTLLKSRALDSKSIGSLVMVICGAIGYCLTDKGFQIQNMMWVFAYGVCNAAYPIVTQLVIRAKCMTSWGRTYYNNIMTFVIFLPMVFVLGEDKGLMQRQDQGLITTWGLILLLMSCIWGTAISFLGFLVLENVSATTFNVMGNSNKILTLVVNGFLWEKHASVQANMCLLVSLVGAALYAEARRQQANADKAADKAAKAGYDEEEGKEMLAAEIEEVKSEGPQGHAR